MIQWFSHKMLQFFLQYVTENIAQNYQFTLNNTNNTCTYVNLIEFITVQTH